MIKARIAAYGESTFKGYGNGTENDAYATPRLLQSARGVSVVDLDNLALSGVDLRSQMGFNGPKIQDYKLTDYYPFVHGCSCQWLGRKADCGNHPNRTGHSRCVN